MRKVTKTVLVVEDYEDARALMRLALEVQGLRVMEATNGREAVETVQRELPDLILMDLSMPEMDGVTATRLIKTVEKAMNVPIIAITAHAREYTKDALEAGCVDVIPKPIDLNTIKPLIEMYLES